MNPTISTLPDELAQASQDWLVNLRAEHKSPRTQRLYTGVLISLSAFLRDRGMPTDPASITGEHIREYLADQLTRLSPATARARHSYLSVFFNYLLAEGEIKSSPMARIKPPKLDERDPDLVSDDDYKKLLRACAGTHLTDRRDFAMIRLLEETGMRRAECAALKVDDVDLLGQVAVVMGKGRKERVCPFTPETSQALTRYIRERNRTRWAKAPELWIGHVGPLSANAIGEMLERRARAAGIPKVHPHAFRHRWADSLKRDGMSEENLMALGGWRDHKIMARYGKLNRASRAEEEYRRLRG